MRQNSLKFAPSPPSGKAISGTVALSSSRRATIRSFVSCVLVECNSVGFHHFPIIMCIAVRKNKATTVR